MQTSKEVLAVRAWIISAAIAFLAPALGGSAHATVNCRQVNKYLALGRSVRDLSETMMIPEAAIERCRDEGHGAMGSGEEGHPWTKGLKVVVPHPRSEETTARRSKEEETKAISSRREQEREHRTGAYATPDKARAPVELAHQIVMDTEGHEWLQEAFGGDITRLAQSLEVKEIDLDGDGRTDYLVTPTDSGRCGSGGCSLYIYRRSDSGYAVLFGEGPTEADGMLTNHISREVVDIGPGRTNGYLDVRLGGRSLRYDGERYKVSRTERGATSTAAADAGPVFYVYNEEAHECMPRPLAELAAAFMGAEHHGCVNILRLPSVASRLPDHGIGHWLYACATKPETYLIGALERKDCVLLEESLHDYLNGGKPR